MNLLNLFDVLGIRLQVNYRINASSNNLSKWYATSQLYIKDGNFRSSCTGNGDTPHEALVNYAKKLSEEIIIYETAGSGRQETGPFTLTYQE